MTLDARCEAKEPVALFPRMWRICGAPAVVRARYECACGHAREGATCAAHAPAEGEVGCARCFDTYRHECPMTFTVTATAQP
jgi:hypothetical protein